jgi:hypothetical protein
MKFCPRQRKFSNVHFHTQRYTNKKKSQIFHIQIQHHREKNCRHHIYYLDVFGFVASDYFMNRHHQSDGKQNYFNYREVHFKFFSTPQYYKK